MNASSFFSKYKSIITFLILEILALVSFTFANINEVFYIITTVLTICAFLFAFFTNNDRKDYLKLIPVVAGLFIISGIAAFGGFSHSFSLLSNVATFFALPSFFALGFFARRIGDIKFEHILLAIGFGLAAITLVGTITTWIQYGPFYAQIHKAKPIYFYDGVAYNATKEMGWLMGFRISEVAIEYGSMFAIMCAVFLPALLFIKIKEQRNLFICSAVIGGIGFISLLTIPNWKALIFLVIASLFAFVYKFLKEKKLVCNILYYIVVGIVGLGVVFFLLTILNAGIGFKFTGIFNKVMCNNFIMRPATNTLSAAFAKDINGVPFNLFGYDLSNQAAYIIGLNAIVEEPTLIFEYEVIKEVGVIGLVFVLAFFVTMFVFVTKYVKHNEDNAFVKNVIIMMLIAFLLLASFGYNVKSEPHNLNVYQPFLRSVPFMIALFLFGFTYFAPNKQPEPVIQKVEEASL
ncbi:MAG: hypothetical protein KBS97_00815 [Firmicutes bacterium]|nr:hypothetical protein [Candidatus Fiminaster equi]